ncbi:MULTISPECIES: HNH endonuclease [unclassified Mesorhizobium]|uniref:HNH endonuclease n=1 Tax=unclassified Mesorhizobium TaxID=325217 RepID=UPI000A46A35D|nr:MULTISPECIES: HNH endonuclease [unclassified Mesorhizobium]MBN9257793.1 HNH endonuclease [Mesorhizobium sp.]MBN9275270.1 HNH endonuclease [Mesorhizobium sp.]
MIMLTKGAEPAILAKNSEKWTTELEAEILNGGDNVSYRTSKYNTKEIKSALQEEVNGKCAYCESKLLHVTYGDIEHIVPKSTDIKLTFAWPNLTLACDKCNTYKAAKIGIYDPYGSNPELDFRFYGPMISHSPGSDVAEITHIELELNRAQLLERRHEKIKSLLTSLDRLANIADNQMRELLKNSIISHESSPEREFSACLKSLIETKRQRGEI